MKLPASYYQQFDADVNLDVPAESFGGWQQEQVEIDPRHTALVILHAWEMGTPQQYPGWHRCAEFIGRAQRICREVFPPMLQAARQGRFNIFHVAGPTDYYKRYPGYAITQSVAKAPEEQQRSAVKQDPSYRALMELRRRGVHVGLHNEQDVKRGFEALDFAPQARPMDDEPIAGTSSELMSVCEDREVNHLIYAGFTIDGCMLISPGGMIDMSRRGLICSVIPQATTAIENKQTARQELAKQVALWRVGLLYGFLFDLDDLIAAWSSLSTTPRQGRA